MTQVKVTVWTMEKDNLAQGGTECKFYRVYHVGDEYSVIQYGSQRAGRSGGSFRIEHNLDYAINQRDKKRREGYTNVVPEFNITFDIDLDKFKARQLNGDKAAGEFLDNVREAMLGAGRASPSARQPVLATSSFTCSECAMVFDQALALRRHMGGAHGPGTKPQTPDIPASVADRLTALTERALTAIATAADDPQAAMVAYATLKEEQEALALDLRKADSYLSTLETLVEEAVTA